MLGVPRYRRWIERLQYKTKKKSAKWKIVRRTLTVVVVIHGLGLICCRKSTQYIDVGVQPCIPPAYSPVSSSAVRSSLAHIGARPPHQWDHYACSPSIDIGVSPTKVMC